MIRAEAYELLGSPAISAAPVRIQTKERNSTIIFIIINQNFWKLKPKLLHGYVCICADLELNATQLYTKKDHLSQASSDIISFSGRLFVAFDHHSRTATILLVSILWWSPLKLTARNFFETVNTGGWRKAKDRYREDEASCESFRVDNFVGLLAINTWTSWRL